MNEFTMRAVAVTEEPLKRLLDILNGRDPKYFLSACKGAESKNGIEFDYNHGLTVNKQPTHLLYCDIKGHVLYSCASFFFCKENKKRTHKNGAHLIGLETLCRRLNMAVEVYNKSVTEEWQEWFYCNHRGVLTFDDTSWIPANPDEVNFEEDEGGFDAYGLFETTRDIWKGTRND